MRTFAATVTLLFFSLFALSANAGHLVGNGGNVIQCRNGGPYHLQLLDTFEHSFYFDEPPIIDGPTQRHNFEILVNRLRVFDPEIGLLVDAYYQQFFEKAKFLDNVELSSSEDTRPVFLPTNCQLEQVVTQIFPQQPSKRYRYFVNAQIWKTLSYQTQATLLLHETLISILVDKSGKELEESSSVRRMVGLTSADSLSRLTKSESEHLRRLFKPVLNAIDLPFKDHLKSRNWTSRRNINPQTEQIVTLQFLENDQLSVKLECVRLGQSSKLQLTTRASVTEEGVPSFELPGTLALESRPDENRNQCRFGMVKGARVVTPIGKSVIIVDSIVYVGQ